MKHIRQESNRQAISLPASPRIGFLGFGEVAYHLALGLGEAGLTRMVAYNDGSRNRPPYSRKFRERAGSASVSLVSSLASLVKRSDLIFSCVTGPVSLEVARQIAPLLNAGKFYVDVNNSTPEDREMAAASVSSSGGRFVDVAIVGSPITLKQKVPMWASGEWAPEFKTVMGRYGMNIEIIPGKAGTSAMLKAIWQVYTKGHQALIWETLLAARKAGIDLEAHPYPDAKFGHETISHRFPSHLICHAAIHAARKAGELHGTAETLRRLGIEPLVTEAASKRLSKLASFHLKEKFSGEAPAKGFEDIIQAMEESGLELT